MDGDLAARLEAVLSDPGQMEKLAKMAGELLGGKDAAARSGEGRPDAVPAPPVSPALDQKVLSALSRNFGGGEKNRSTALLLALRPYMKPEKQEKLDRAMQIARMARIAGTVMEQLGGSGHGL